MEKSEATSGLQSRLSSLSVSSFPGITSKNCENKPQNRFQNTDLSPNSNTLVKHPDMDDDSKDNQEAHIGRAMGDLEVNSQLNAESKGHATPVAPAAPTPALLPPVTWTSAGLKELKAKLRQEKGAMVTVYRGDIMTVRVPTTPEGARVCWEFATDGYDIGFGVYFDWTPVTSRAITVHVSESSDDEDEEDELEGPVKTGDVERGSKSSANANLGEILPVYRQDSHLAVQGGSHEFPGEGTYLLKFDNSYSLWRNKTLYYRVYYSA